MWLTVLTARAAEPAPPMAAEVAELVQKIEARYREISTLSADFVQVSKSRIYGEERQTGRLLLARPNHMRWQFDGTEGRLFLADGTTLWIYSPGERQVVQSAQGQGSGGADVLLDALSHLSERFTATLTPPPPGGVWHLVMVPKDPANPYARYEIGLSADLTLEELILVDGQETVTRLDFTGVTLGAPIAPEQFRFEAPPGVEVVRMGG